MDYNRFVKQQLHHLLSRFVSNDLLTESVLEECHDYLFKAGPLPFFVDSELFDTTIYLKDIMASNNLDSLEDVLCFYQKKREGMKILATEILEKNCSLTMSEFKPLELKTIHLNSLIGESAPESFISTEEDTNMTVPT